MKKWCEDALRWIKSKLGDSSVLASEFASIQVGDDEFVRLQFAARNAEAGKNRYRNILPYADATRVVLRSARGGSSYINASFIKGSSQIPTYIAAQGPLNSTVVDFWEMVMQQRCPVIVMLTKLSDATKERCAPYFPEELNESRVYGRLRVTNKEVIVCNSLVKRLFEIQSVEAGEKSLQVLHVAYTGWPDFGVPPTTTPICEIFKCLKALPVDNGPFLVHCSAGVGRTGTYVTIDQSLRRIVNGDLSAASLREVVRDLRQQRFGMVETQAQYQFCYQIIAAELEELLAS